MSCFYCCTRRAGQPHKRASEYSKVVKPVLVAINTRDSDGVQEQGTGILINDHLVITSHMGLPTSDSAREGHIALRDVGPSNFLPNKWPSSSTILTRKLLPRRLFVTNPGLGLTIVACEAVNSSSSPRNYDVPKASEDGLKLGCSVYVVGQVQHDHREGLLMFGEGLISKEDEQVIEFYSLDGYAWTPGSAGFDAKGTFAFVVGDHRPNAQVICPLLKRWSCALSKGPSSRQPGILIHAVHDWTKDTWSGDLKTLLEICNSGPPSLNDTSSSALKPKTEEAEVIERKKALSRQIDQIRTRVRDDTEATNSKVRNCRKYLYRATDSNSTMTSPKVKEILPMSVLVPCNNLDAKVQSCTVKPQSPPKLGGIAALATEVLDKYDDKSERFVQREATGNEIATSPPDDWVDASREVDVYNEQGVTRDEISTSGSPEDKLRSPRSCWLSSWWSNFRPKSPQQQRGQSVHAAAVDSAAITSCAKHDDGRTEESEPNSPPRRFLVRGAYTATPRREFSSTQINSHVSSARATKPSSPYNSSSPSHNMLKPSSPPRTVRPCQSTTLQPCSRPLSPEIPYLQIHRAPTSGCPRQSDNPWKPPGEPDSRRILPSCPPRLLTGVARTQTYPRDSCLPRSEEDEQTKFDEAAGRKVSADTRTKVEVSAPQSDATGSQDHITRSPYAIQTSPLELYCGENGTLEIGSSKCLLESSASQSPRNHHIPKLNGVILPKSIQQISTSSRRLTSRRTSQRMIECTCFHIWHKFVTRKKNVVVQSMKSLFSPRAFSVSSVSSRSISPSPALGSPPPQAMASHNVTDSEALPDDGAAWFLGSPLSSINHNGSECPALNTSSKQQPHMEQQEVPTTSNSNPTQMPNWALKVKKIRDETLHHLSKDAGGPEGDTTVEAAAAQEEVWNMGTLLSQQDGAEVGDRSPSTTSRSEGASRNYSPCARIGKCMMPASKKEQRKQTSNQRPRWSIARLDKGPLNIGSNKFDPLGDLTKSTTKLRLKKQQLLLVDDHEDTGAAMNLPHSEVFVPKKGSAGVRALANEIGLSIDKKSKHERRKPALDYNCKANVSSKNPVTEPSSSRSKPPVGSSSQKLSETPTARKGSSAPSSSSEREGRPRWRCSSLAPFDYASKLYHA